MQLHLASSYLLVRLSPAPGHPMSREAVASSLLTQESVSLLQKAVLLARSAREGLGELMEEWRQQQLWPEFSQYLLVKRSDLDQLVSEAMMLKEFLPSLLSPEHLSAMTHLTTAEQKLQAEVQEKGRVMMERDALQRRARSLLADYEREKQEKFSAKCELSDSRQQLQQQADYCASLGSTCGTLLWRASQNEECIQTLLSGSQIAEFLQLVGVTVESFLATYGQDPPADDSEEAQFVLSLCGTVTNIAASAYGRDFLSTNAEGKALLETMCSVLSSSPLSPHCAKMRSLILMLLYNTSINQKGLQLLISQSSLLSVLVWVAQEDSYTLNKVHSLRLLQSLILDPHTPLLRHKALEAIPMKLLETLSSSPNTELQEAACELMADLNFLQQQC